MNTTHLPIRPANEHLYDEVDLQLNELYTSVQGEGPNTGLLTQFVRFSSCNLRCPGWPCDTPHAIKPELWRNDPRMSSYDLMQRVNAERTARFANNICITGGEPLLQKGLRKFVYLIQSSGFTVEIFTNGTCDIDIFGFQRPAIMMDWKLRGSGEAGKYRDKRITNLSMLSYRDGLKFVVVDDDDFHEAVELVHQYRTVLTQITRPQIWVAPAWDRMQPEHLVDLLKGEPTCRSWRLNLQTHKYIWPNLDRGI
jgi:7-carboxy-7-deazaguanine synthase